MKIQCPQCQETHIVNQDRIPETGAKAKCKACGMPFRVEKENDHVDHVTCPKCGYDQPKADTCKYCGVIFDKAKKPAPPPPHVAPEETGDQTETEQAGSQPNPTASVTTRSKTLLYVISSIVIIGLAWVGYSKYAEAKYAKKIDSTAVDILDASQKCLNMCARYRLQWRMAIDTGGDFNEELKKAIAYSKEMGDIESINKKNKAIAREIKSMAVPPDDYRAAYLKLVSLYGEYSELNGLASSPSGSLQSYTAAIQQSEDRIAKLMSEIMVMTP